MGSPIQVQNSRLVFYNYDAATQGVRNCGEKREMLLDLLSLKGWLDAQQVTWIRDNDLGQSLTEIKVGRDNSYTREKVRNVKEKKLILRKYLPTFQDRKRMKSEKLLELQKVKEAKRNKV